MAKSCIASLSKMQFVKNIIARRKIISKASDAPVPPLSTYKANQLAAALHPEKQFLKVAKIIEHGKGIKTFTLVPNPLKGTTRLAYFSAGQYLSISLNIENMCLTRPYSLCSSPKYSLENKYEITVKAVDGGLASNYILDNWDINTEVQSSAPLGVFTFEPLRDSGNIIGIAGGSGVTPFLSLAKAIADGDEDASLTLLYGSRTSEDILFRKEFDMLQASCSKIKIVHVLSNEIAEGFEHGFITAELIKKYAPAEGSYSIFLCGPQALYDFADKQIATLGIKPKFVRHEVFGEYRNPEKNADYPTDARDKHFKLTAMINGEAKIIDMVANDTILVALEKNGIAAPSECRSGICGWCRSRLLEGKVYIPKTVDGRRLADKDYGYIHPCCTFAVSDITIDVLPTK